MSAVPLVELEDVRFAHGGSFQLFLEHFLVLPGEALALIGPSGSGKSTLIDLIAGIRLPAAGRIRVLGQNWSLLTEEGRRAVRRSRIGMAFQEFELLDYLTARENILLACYVGGTQEPRSALLQRAEGLAAAAGIQSVLDRSPARLSQGERQRVALCRALLTRPPLILCDEPTGNLDPKSSADVIRLLLNQAREDGSTLLMATHDHSLIPRFDRVFDLSGASEAGTKGRAP